MNRENGSRIERRARGQSQSSAGARVSETERGRRWNHQKRRVDGPSADRLQLRKCYRLRVEGTDKRVKLSVRSQRQAREHRHHACALVCRTRFRRCISGAEECVQDCNLHAGILSRFPVRLSPSLNATRAHSRWTRAPAHTPNPTAAAVAWQWLRVQSCCVRRQDRGREIG